MTKKDFFEHIEKIDITRFSYLCHNINCSDCPFYKKTKYSNCKFINNNSSEELKLSSTNLTNTYIKKEYEKYKSELLGEKLK